MELRQARVLVIGAGPAGLAITACLRREGISPRLVDASGMVGGAYRRLYPRITLSSPARWITLPGMPIDCPGEYATVHDYSQYLQRYAGHHQIEAETGEVSGVSPYLTRFKVSWKTGQDELFHAVVAATGLDTPVSPPIPSSGEGPQFLHSRDWQGCESFAGRRVLIVGRATSAVEIAEECARAGLHPVLSAHDAKVSLGPQRILGRDVHDFIFPWSWLPLWLAGSYCRRSPTFPGTDLGFSQLRKAGQLSVRSEVIRFQGKTALFATGECLDFDVVVMATGYRWGMPYLPSEVARSAGDGHPLGKGGESISCPGLYLMGVHCCRGVSSQFLRGMALDAGPVAVRIRRRLEGLPS